MRTLKSIFEGILDDSDIDSEDLIEEILAKIDIHIKVQGGKVRITQDRPWRHWNINDALTQDLFEYILTKGNHWIIEDGLLCFNCAYIHDVKIDNMYCSSVYIYGNKVKVDNVQFDCNCHACSKECFFTNCTFGALVTYGCDNPANDTILHFRKCEFKPNSVDFTTLKYDANGPDKQLPRLPEDIDPEKIYDMHQCKGPLIISYDCPRHYICNNPDQEIRTGQKPRQCKNPKWWDYISDHDIEFNKKLNY